MAWDSTTLFVEHRRSLVDYAAGILGSRAHAEDVVQEAWIRFTAANDGSEGPSTPILHPIAYLYTIVRNLALNGVRRASYDAPAPTQEDLAAVASDAPSVEAVLLHRDELRVLAGALAELPERTRLAFQMSRVEGRPLREIADRLDISIGRAHQLVRTAMIHGARRLRDSRS